MKLRGSDRSSALQIAVGLLAAAAVLLGSYARTSLAADFSEVHFQLGPVLKTHSSSRDFLGQKDWNPQATPSAWKQLMTRVARARRDQAVLQSEAAASRVATTAFVEVVDPPCRASRGRVACEVGASRSGRKSFSRQDPLAMPSGFPVVFVRRPPRVPLLGIVAPLGPSSSKRPVPIDNVREIVVSKSSDRAAISTDVAALSTYGEEPEIISGAPVPSEEIISEMRDDPEQPLAAPPTLAESSPTDGPRSMLSVLGMDELMSKATPQPDLDSAAALHQTVAQGSSPYCDRRALQLFVVSGETAGCVTVFMPHAMQLHEAGRKPHDLSPVDAIDGDGIGDRIVRIEQSAMPRPLVVPSSEAGLLGEPVGDSSVSAVAPVVGPEEALPPVVPASSIHHRAASSIATSVKLPPIVEHSKLPASDELPPIIEHTKPLASDELPPVVEQPKPSASIEPSLPPEPPEPATLPTEL